ncbi:dihydrolipoyl dehydrogenase [Sphingobium cupriresistens]|jgi:dihydrolipoamide dehydrogenase|uniref:Dihydrolipoyl dehydrogenase n=1 Tax=Sphingobium cupriresistens LL01 TaxID=1420583 RepID=A0A0J7XFW4_9SPHN|nr:dihydrolipoyl dehydrogenase [Sphingobium cupriresistens]KMS50951.1 dihydrolipoamide dehydrogenase [Sphingobium cupriresistens LL01]MDE0945421.1 dihydrolipoyl dehydrogenase [Sphingobium sp.]
MSDSFDIIVIGGGTAGYPAAIRASQLGMSVACIERRPTLGGTCLNVGCIPSKALLHSTEIFAEVSEGLEEHGIGIGGVALNLRQMIGRKDEVVDGLTKGVEHLLKKNTVEWVKGSARFEASDRLAIDLVEGGTRTLTASKGILVATGSDVARLPGIDIDEERIVSNTGALSLNKVPEHLVVIGGGYIGLELGCVWRRLGAKVTVIEFLENIVPSMDREIARHLLKLLKQQGLDFRFETKVTGVEKRDADLLISVEPAKGGATETLDADVVLVAVGRKPYTEGLGLDRMGITLDPKGRIPVELGFKTAVSGIYAIGDVIAGPMLAHKTTLDGVRCVEGIAGRYPGVDYNTVPAVIYTSPEVASVGKTEEELKAAGIDYKSGTFPFLANSRARCNGDTRGLTKLLADAKTDRLLGAHIIGPDAGTMIHEAVLAMEYGGTTEDIALTTHAHPTLPESLKEAALVLLGQGMHI